MRNKWGGFAPLFIFLIISITYLYWGHFNKFPYLPKYLWILRGLRATLAIFTGYVLTLNGTLLQVLTHNPLAEPYILGISGGAFVGMLIGRLFNIQSGLFLSIPAMIGGMGAGGMVYSLSSMRERVSVESMLIIGMLINIFASNIVVLSAYFLNISPTELLYLLFGSLNLIFTKQEIIIFFIVCLLLMAASGIFFFLKKELLLFSLSEEEAWSAGVDTDRLKLFVFSFIIITTSYLVALEGLIGFVGLIVPYLIRSLHEDIFDFKAYLILGGSFMLLADFISSHIFPYEIPIGAITGIIGVIFFFIIHLKNVRILAQ